MNKKLYKLLVLAIAVTLLSALFAVPASATPSITDIQAVPYRDGVLLTYTPTNVSWCEIVMTDEALPSESEEFWAIWNNYGKMSRPNNNACYNSAFVNADSTFSTGISTTFENTPGNKYYFYILSHDGGDQSWALVGKTEYTVPALPVASLGSDGNTIEFNYTEGAQYAVYEYPTQADALANTNGELVDNPTSGTFSASSLIGTHFYRVAKNIALTDDKVKPSTSETNDQGISNFAVIFDCFNKTMTLSYDNSSLNTVWTICDISVCDGYSVSNGASALLSTSIRFAEAEGFTDVNGAVTANPVTFSTDGTSPLTIVSGTDAGGNPKDFVQTKLMPGLTYTLTFTSYAPDEANQWPNSKVTFTVPQLQFSDVVTVVTDAVLKLSIDGVESDLPTVNGAVVLPADPAPLADGSTFKEWNTQADGQGETVTASTQFEDGMFIYAIFESAPVQTADLSVIGYAVAALLACGGIVVAKKRK